MYPEAVAQTNQELEFLFGSLLDEIPLLKNRDSLSELSGGLTNRNLLVSCGVEKYVARISSNSSALLAIDRESEFQNSQLAATAGIGAPIHGYLPGKGLLLVGYLPGKTFSAADVGANLSRIAQSCRTLHSAKPFRRDFNMFEIQKNYLSIVQERGFALPKGYLEYGEQIRQIQRALSMVEIANVPCNNDLLPGNFIDGGEKIWIIDYEYSGNNDPCFELGNIWAESYLELEQLEELVTAYFGGHNPQMLARAWLQVLVGKYGWALWASIQSSISEIDFDFWGWGMEKYEKAESEFQSEHFKQALAQVSV